MLSGKAWQQAIFERDQADDRYGLRDGGPAEELYLRDMQRDPQDYAPAGLERVHRVSEDDLEDAA